MNKQAGYTIIGVMSVLGAVYLAVNAQWIMAAVMVFLALGCLGMMGIE